MTLQVSEPEGGHRGDLLNSLFPWRALVCGVGPPHFSSWVNIPTVCLLHI